MTTTHRSDGGGVAATAAAASADAITLDDAERDLFEAKADVWLQDRPALSTWLTRSGLILMQLLFKIATTTPDEGREVTAAMRAVQLYLDAANRLLAVLPSASKCVHCPHCRGEAQVKEPSPGPTTQDRDARPLARNRRADGR